MFRRCVAILVLCGFLVGQLATTPHAHLGTSVADQQEHDARPHFHLGGERHAEEHRCHKPDVVATGSPAQTILCACAGEHDADAIYLPAGTGSLQTAGDPGSPPMKLAMTAAPDMVVAQASHTGSRNLTWHHRPPDPGQLAGKIFLNLRTLRI